MADLVFGKLFQLMRRPMAKIERPRRAEFERVAGSGDMIEMQLRATINQSLHCSRLKCPKGFGFGLDDLEELPIANEGHLQSFDVTRAFVSSRQGIEQLKIIHHCKGRRESSDEILLAKRVNSVLHTDTRVRLAQSSGGN